MAASIAIAALLLGSSLLGGVQGRPAALRAEQNFQDPFPVEVEVVNGKCSAVDVTTVDITITNGSQDSNKLAFLLYKEGTDGATTCLKDGVASGGGTITKSALCVGGIVQFSVHFGEDGDHCSACEPHESSTSRNL